MGFGVLLNPPEAGLPFLETEMPAKDPTTYGVITFWLCEAAEISPFLTAARFGIAGHMRSQALVQFENWTEAWIVGRGRGQGDD